MTDITCSSNEGFSHTVSDVVFDNDDILDDNEIPSIKNKASARQRLEEALERRFLEKDVQEFIFDY